MATERFSVSMPGEVRKRLKQHAAAAGLDVSTFLAIAAQAQMDQQDRVKKVFAPFGEARSAAEEEAGTGAWAGDDIALTHAEQAEVDAILGRPSRGETAA